MNVNEVVIIGGGIAGIAAAVQLKRQGIELALIEKDQPGGLIKNAFRIDNYPGFPNGISGTKITGLLLKHLQRFDIKIIKLEVEKLIYRDDKFEIISSDCKKLHSKFLILACGTKPKNISGVRIDPPAKNKIFQEAYPLFGVKGKTICIIGGGDAAFDYALSLSEKNKILILNRSSKIKCIHALKQETGKCDNIRYYENKPVRSIDVDEGRLILNKDIVADRFECDYFIYAIGRKPDLALTEGEFGEQTGNLIRAKRLYLIGDMNNANHRQLSISSGEGIKAAMEIYDEINKS